MKRKREVTQEKRAGQTSPSDPKRRRIGPPRRAKVKAPATKPALWSDVVETCQLPTPTSASASQPSSPPPPTPSPWAWRSMLASPNSASNPDTRNNNPHFGDEVCRAYRINQLNEHLRQHKYGAAVASEWKKGATPEESRLLYAQKQVELRRLADDEDTSTGASSDEEISHASEKPRSSVDLNSDGKRDAVVRTILQPKSMRKLVGPPSPPSPLQQIQ